MKERLRIVLASRFLIRYPQGGGHWSAFLQHLLGLDALGHDVFWLELYRPGKHGRDAALERTFRERMDGAGFAGRWAIGVVKDHVRPDLDTLEIVGHDTTHVHRFIKEADLLWNFACAIRSPFLARFRRRALIDGDPGIIHVSAEQNDMGLDKHEVLFTAGLNVGRPECPVPTHGRVWHPFRQFIHIPIWPAAAPTPARARYTSITQWNWGEIWHNGAIYSMSKRDAYMRLLDLPRRCQAGFELAANIDPCDPTGDVVQLRGAGWALVDPHEVAGSPEAYRAYIRGSRGELCCPKPIYVEMRTGWFSDRSAGYLASSRPVVMQDTTVGQHLPVGSGLLTFSDLETAAEAVASVESNYAAHAAAARAFALEHLRATQVLAGMLEACA